MASRIEIQELDISELVRIVETGTSKVPVDIYKESVHIRGSCYIDACMRSKGDGYTRDHGMDSFNYSLSITYDAVFGAAHAVLCERYHSQATPEKNKE